MLKRICDRCKKEIKGNYWTIDIYQHEDVTNRMNATGAAHNLEQNMRKILNRQDEYCTECIEEIKEKIRGKVNE